MCAQHLFSTDEPFWQAEISETGKGQTMLETGVILVCLLFNALLAGTEMAFAAVSKPSLRQWSGKGIAVQACFFDYESP